NDIAALVGPRPLHAATAVSLIHIGVGGLCGASRCLSSPIFTWGLLADMTINDGNNQTVGPASTLPTAPSVIVKDSGGGAVAGATVTFSVASGNGSITGAVDTTGADGIARLGSWTLPSAPGTYSLTATLPGAGGSPQTFTATRIPVGIASASVSPTTLPIGGLEGTATVSVTNGTGAPASGLVVQGYILQGAGESAARRFGGTSLQATGDPFTCASDTCTLPGFNFSANGAGTGTLVCGSASAEFDLMQGETLLQTFTIPITLSSAGPCP